ncbi:hypothetical protein FACS189474_1240 [Bacteroidia bacterium]|nr:hypothetical protein FACS189474_1240 [Bacteroidia bacterium]
MKKNLILMMLLLTGAVSMIGQEIADPIMVVTGNVVNTGKLISKGPIDLRTNPGGGISQIDNTGEIKTPALNVDENTLLNNLAGGDICVGCVVYTASIIPNGAKDYNITPNTDNSAGTDGSMAKDWTSAANDVGSGNYWSPYPATGANPSTGGINLMVSNKIYSSTDSVASPTASGINEYAAVSNLSALQDGIDWETAVKKCASLVEGGYDDWYLPNSMELEVLWDNGYLGFASIGSRVGVSYWCSTEISYLSAWVRGFTETGLMHKGNATKANDNFDTGTYVARCVRRN